MKRQTLLFLVCVLTLFAAVQKAGAATVYEYTDDNSVTFYFTVDGTEATICNSGGTSSKTTSYTNGSIEVPSSVTYSETTYTVTAIGAYAFYQCTELTNITLPSTVTSIGNYAFYGCSSLTSIDLSECTSLTSLGTYCFTACSLLTSIDLSKCTSLTSLGDRCFAACSELESVTLPSNVTSLGNYCFYDCTSLTSIDLGGCTSLGDYCFRGCSALESVTLPSSVTSLGTYCFYSCTSLTSIDLSACTSLTSLPQCCFYYCSALTSIDLSKCTSLTSLSNSCFMGCSALTSITLPSKITTIDTRCFYECSSLTSIEIPNTVTSLGGNVFYGCTSLQSVGLPCNESITSLGTYNQVFGMFYGCSALTDIYYYDSDNQKKTGIPSYITKIGNCCFYNCSSLTSIEIPNTVTSLGIGVFYGCALLQSVGLPCNESVTSLSTYDLYGVVRGMFCGCSALTDIYYYDSDNQKQTGIPSYITAIGNRCFKSCSSLTSIEIPNTVTSLGSGVFYGCTSLQSVGLPCNESVTSLSACSYTTSSGGTGYYGMFYGCSALTDIYYYDSDNQKQTGIPSYITSLEIYCFRGCSALTSIDLSNCTSLTSIGQSCFYQCTSLESITLPESVTSLGNYCIYGCSALTSIDLSKCASLTSLSDYCIYQCTSLTSIDLSGCTSLTSLGKSCFYNCTSLESITLPESITSLGDYCFRGCTSLTSVDLSQCTLLTSLGNYCFCVCSALMSVTLPESITSLGNYCFRGTSLESITLPESITSLGNYCFYACSSLAKVKVYATSAPTLGTSVFGNNADGRIIYVPPFSLSSYQEAENMTDYAEQINPFVDQTVSGSAGMGTIALPFDATIPDGLTVYTVGSLNEDGTEVALTAVSSGEALAAGTPCIVMISDEEESDGDTATASEDEEEETTTTANLECEWLGTTNALGTDDNETTYTVESVVSKDNAYGVFQKTTLTSAGISSGDETSTASEDEYTYYILQQHSGDETPKFYKVGSTNVTVGAYRAYLALSSSESTDAESIAFTFVENDEVTGIGSVSAEQTAGSGLYYDLQGRQVRTPQKGGIYIKDGKKVVI